MNVAIVTSEFVSESDFDGGLANYTYKLAKWLQGNGHKVTVYLASAEEGVNSFEEIAIVKVKHIDYSWLIQYYANMFKIGRLFSEKFRVYVRFRMHSRAFKKKLIQEHKQNKIDIIHYPHLLGYAFYRPNHIPSIVRLSSSTALCYQMGGYGSSDTQMFAQENFEMKAMNNVDAVFGPSKMVAALTEKMINKKIDIIETPYIKPEGISDLQVFENELKNKKYILFFGSIGLIKGVATIARIIKPLLEKHKDLHYVFVGKKLNNSIEGLSIWDFLVKSAGENSNRIIYIASQKHISLFPIIQNALMVTLPSRTDNFPNACIEAMANKKIVIGTKGNGFDQLIDDGQSGYLINVDDHADLLNKIELVLNLSSAQKNEIEKKAFERTEKLHPDFVLNELIDFYQKTISEFKN